MTKIQYNDKYMTYITYRHHDTSNDIVSNDTSIRIMTITLLYNTNSMLKIIPILLAIQNDIFM